MKGLHMDATYFSIAIKGIIICLSAYSLHIKTGLPLQVKKTAFLFFTTLNTVACFTYFIFALALDESRVMRQINGGVMLCAIITMSVYHFVLIPNIRKHLDHRIFSLPDIVVHYAIPLLVVIDWLLFSEKGYFTYYSPFLWYAPFIVYFIAVVISARCGVYLEYAKSRYPYYFIDYDKLGLLKVTRNAALMFIGVIGLGYILVFIDNLL